MSAPAAPFAVVTTPIDRVVPYVRNPRKNAAAIAKVAASLREFGWRQPIVVDEHMTVIAGHTRLEAARSLGMTEVPVHIATGLSASQIKAYRIADNRVGEEAEWDNDALALELSALELDDFDLALTGFDPAEMDAILGRVDSAGFPDLPSGDKAPYRQMTFTLHNTQAADVETAIGMAKVAGAFTDGVNENSNGNALARICAAYIAAGGSR